MKKLYFLALCMCVAAATATAQTCTQTLRLVRSTYEQGRLHELPDLMKGCLAKKPGEKDAWTKEERREALRYLTLAHIYLEEPEEADKTMLELLNTDHFYVPNDKVDPAEFMTLYNKFRHDPLYKISLKFGMNVTQPVVNSYFNVGSAGAGQGGYQLVPSFQVSLAFEKDFFKKLPITMSGELGFTTRSYTYSNSQLAVADEDPKKAISNQEFAISQKFLDINIIGQYKFVNTINLQTYVGAGPGFSYMLGSSNLASTVLGNGFTVTGISVDDINSYNRFLYSAIAVAGVKYRFGEVYLTAEARLQVGFRNVVNPGARTNPEIAYDYQGRYNDYKINNAMINIGVTVPFFKPKKLVN